MIRWCGPTIALVGICAVVSANEPAFRYTKPLDLPTLKQEELLAATFDSDVYAITRDGLPDVRIIADHSTATSYLLRKATVTKTETARDYWAARTRSVRPLDDGGLEIILHLEPEDPRPAGLRIVTPLHNFEQRVQVFSSADGENWQPVGAESLIFDYSQYMDFGSDDVAFPPSDNRNFRIVIDDVTQEQESQLMSLTRQLRGGKELQREERTTIDRRPFRIDRVLFWRDVVKDQSTGDRKVTYPVAGFRLENDPDNQQSIITVTSRRQPLTSFKLVTDSRNFSRRAQVEVEDTQGVQRTWRSIGGANLSRLDFRNLKREDLTISFPESRQNKYRIVIDNRGSQPLAVTSVEAEGNEYQAVFLAPLPQQSYELSYGSATALAPDYDTAAISASLAEGYQPTLVGLGKQVDAAGAGEPAAPSLSQIVNNPLVLGGIAVVLVAALAWGLYHAGHRLDSLSQDDH
jgi:Protein of unknown function (DUF3999)